MAQGSNDIDLMAVASLMPMPDGVLLLAALGGPGAWVDRGEDAAPASDTAALALLFGGATLALGLLALLPVPV